MGLKLDKVVPIGRSLGEYIKMFNLTEKDLQKNIIGVGDGPASFNAEATQIGSKVISIDPIYQFTALEIQQRFDAVIDNIMAQVKANPNDWVWSYHQSPEDLFDNRKKSLNKFISDYYQGKLEQRYQIGELPKLHYQDNQFDLALCSHFLFLYSDFYDYQFHYLSIKEMLRISKEIRIFPLLKLDLKFSEYVDKIVKDFKDQKYTIVVVNVEYQLQKGGNQMLQIVKH